MKIFFLFIPLSLFGSILPEYDQNCNALNAKNAKMQVQEEHYHYFNWSIYPRVHQIWFGDSRNLDTSKTTQWESYCQGFGYEYRLWTEKDIPSLDIFMEERNLRLLQFFVSTKNYWAASDILRLELLKHFGGIYADCDIRPPKDDDGYVNFELLAPMKGLTVMTEWHARNIKESGVFASNGFIMSCAHHPVIEAAVSQVSGNVDSWYRQKCNYDAMYCTGPFFLNKILTGCYNVLPITYLKNFGMLGD